MLLWFNPHPKVQDLEGLESNAARAIRLILEGEPAQPQTPNHRR